jgi:hypothetical protein
MRSKVAEKTQQELDRQMLAMTPEQRMELAFALGERDLQLYMAANELTREEALAALRHASQAGRRHYSRSKAGL